MYISWKKIAFLDLEVNYDTKKIEDIGIFHHSKELHTHSIKALYSFLSLTEVECLVGHNIIDFDLEILKAHGYMLEHYTIIDTLPLSLLLFSEKSVHSLPKNYKSEDDFKNNPLEDAKITAKLFEKLLDRFSSLPQLMRDIFYSLLSHSKYFKGFFLYAKETIFMEFLENRDLFEIIYKEYSAFITSKITLEKMLEENRVELAYILSILTPQIEIKAHPPKVLYDYPNILDLQQKLCFDIDEANKELQNFSKEVFGFGEFRSFARLNATLFQSSQISQREMVEAALEDESFLTILPTGGGKTFTFWLPAVYKASKFKTLTVVISPLQALIEDHIKSFNAKVANFKAVAISGFMSPLERAEAIEDVVSGEADILYIAPESLRSNTIFNILKNRVIERFVVDEAHCLSTWGNDFRQDYYYICEFIKELLEKKPFQKSIAISCFTATAKPSVIEDIKNYFYEGLGLKLEEYLATPERKNLSYDSIVVQKTQKYKELLRILHQKEGATLVYIPSSTKECDKVAEQLSLDTDKNVKSFHSKLDSQEKMEILADYINNRIDIIVATTAFGMGVDKANIVNVIHYEVSDSLENYAQEAGRGARDEKLEAYCPILFDENDLDKHFASLNRSKLTVNEVNSVLRVLKSSKSKRISKTAFELAKEAGWDVEDSSSDYATKIKTILLELEREGYISRKRNRTSFFADSIASQSMQRLHKAFEKSNYSQEEKQRLTLVLQTIIGRGKVEAVQIDELAYLLGYEKDAIALSIHQLKELEILGDSKDLSLEIRKEAKTKFNAVMKIEKLLFTYLSQSVTLRVSMREINEFLYQQGAIKSNKIELIKVLLKSWRDKNNFLFKRINREQDLWEFDFKDKVFVEQKIEQKHLLAMELLEKLTKDLTSTKKEKVIFSLKELHEQLKQKSSFKEIDNTLLYLHHLAILELLYGRFINYSPMQIYQEEKIKQKRKYTEYKNRLAPHYKIKIESIHIMGEYAKRLEEDRKKAVLFLKDYFTMPYEKFKKHYKLLKEQLSRPMTQKRFNKIFEDMSEVQQAIIEDNSTKAMMILAGPGSGKTRVLVHKIASLILREDVKPQQFMMLTFSNTAKYEFKHRLNQLIGSLSFDVEIQTFHGYALKLIARKIESTDDKLMDEAIVEATKAIQSGAVQLPLLSVLVLDEYQDITRESFAFVEAIYKASDKDIKIIAVGDDDQCIMEYAGADIGYINQFKESFAVDDEGQDVFKQYQLLCNYRSKKNIVGYSNEFVTHITKRYKSEPLYAHVQEEGEVLIRNYPFANSLIEPVVTLVLEDTKKQDIAILAFSNEEVMQIYSALESHGVAVRYIIEREKYQLKNMVELYELNNIVHSFLLDESSFKEAYFLQALEILQQKYQGSSNLDLVQKIVDRFLVQSDFYYISEWLTYLETIYREDFESDNASIVVTTIHKSKGMEFEKVYLLVNKIPVDDIRRRLYYVGMTRAKKSLNILYKAKQSTQKSVYADYIEDTTPYQVQEKRYTHIMSLGDINLGFDPFRYSTKNNFMAGMQVSIQKRDKWQNLCIIANGKIIAVLSKKFHEEISQRLQKGFVFDEVKIESVVVWFNEKEQKNYLHPLCKIVMKR
jgi:ATP-dependent DNA helicase RecQ